jgi:tRNA threonylcarbamoyladenosine biosynthesis protein TsaE
MATFISKSVNDTLRFATQYAKTLKGGDVVLLEGDMGAGKTVFSKGVAKGLGIDDEITSPTYAYMNDYYGKLYHYDCYRLSCGAQAEGLGLTDYFYSNGICLIEWAQNIADVLPENCKKVTIKKLEGDEREIIYE